MGYGSRETLSTEGAINGQISNTVSARLSLNYVDRGEWIDNTVNGPGDDFGGFDEFAYRLQFLITPNEDLDALIKIHGFEQSGNQPQVFYANAFTPGVKGLRPGFNERVASHDGQSGFELDHFGASAKLDYRFGGISFTSITSYDTLDSFSQADIDGGLEGRREDIGALGRQAFFSVSSADGLDDHSQFSQEFRLSGESEKMFYQVGLYYFDEDITINSTNFTNSGSIADVTFADQKTTSAAIFGQVEYHVSDVLSLTSGLRYTDDEKDLQVIPGFGSLAPAANISAEDDYVSWELAANYDLNEDVALYSRVATASRGPVTLGRFGFTSQADTEDITSYEVGIKARLFDGRARWSAALYSYAIDNQQLTATGGTGNTNELLNAASTDGSGFETEFEMRVTENLRASFNFSYNKTEIKDPNLNVELCSSTPLCTTLDPIVDTFLGPFGTVNLVSVNGNPLPRAPKHYSILV